MATDIDLDYEQLTAHIKDTWIQRQIVSNRQSLTPEFLTDSTYIDHIEKWVTAELAKLMTDYIILDHVLRWGVDTHSSDPIIYLELPQLIERTNQITSMEARFMQPMCIVELQAIVIPRMEHT